MTRGERDYILARIDFSKKLQNSLDVPFWLLVVFKIIGVRVDLRPLGVGNKTMYLLRHITWMYVIVAWEDQGRHPNPPEHLFSHAEAYIGAIDDRMYRIPHYLGELLRRHRLQCGSILRV